MKAQALGWIAVYCAMMAAGGSAALGENVDWVQGDSFPGEWSVWSDGGPGSVFYPDDTLYFSGPLFTTFGNSCEAEAAAGGILSMRLDEMTREIEIYFEPPASTLCPAVWIPVSGLQGEFGPLHPGQWTFFGTTPVASFSESFAIAGEHRPGDTDGDGKVDLDDFSQLKLNFGMPAGARWDQGDFDGDGDVDMDDFVILKNYFGTTIIIIPEPATMALLVLGGLAVVRRRRV